MGGPAGSCTLGLEQANGSSGLGRACPSQSWQSQRRQKQRQRGSCRSVPVFLSLTVASAVCALLLGAWMEAASPKRKTLLIRQGEPTQPVPSSTPLAVSRPGHWLTQQEQEQEQKQEQKREGHPARQALEQPHRQWHLVEEPAEQEAAVQQQQQLPIRQVALGDQEAPGEQQQQQQQPLQQQQPVADSAAASSQHAEAKKHEEPGQDEVARTLADMQWHVAEHGPAGSFYGTGCRWREAQPDSSSSIPSSSQPSGQTVASAETRSERCTLANPRGALFGGMEAVWRCHRYEYWSEEVQAWTAEQPAACRIAAEPLASWMADTQRVQAGDGSVSWGSAAGMSTWGLEAWLQGQQHEAGLQDSGLEGAEGPGGQQATPAAAGADAGTGAEQSNSSPGRPTPQPAAGERNAGRGDVASDARCAGHYCVFRNVWYNGGHFYYLWDEAGPPLPGGVWQLGRARVNTVLSVRSAADFAASVPARVVTGETLVLDYTFFLHPRALGHWQEMLMPVFSILRNEPLVRRTPDRVLLLYQQRSNLCDWLRGLMAAVLGVMPRQDLPPLIFQEEVAEPMDQTHQLLEGVQPGEWLMFEQVLWPKDIFSGGSRGCQSQREAQLLRSLLHTMHGLPATAIAPAPLSDAPAPVPAGPPAAASPSPADTDFVTAQEAAAHAVSSPPSPVQAQAQQRQQRPLRITLQRKGANRRLLNEDEVVEMLREFGEVRVVEFGGGATLAEQLAVMSSTDVYISVHTSNLANAVFLPPGAAIFEILQRNWAWAGIDRFFKSLTQHMGDLHHFAWRAQGTNETLFLHPTLAKLFTDWAPEDCYTQDCVEALTVVDVAADVAALHAVVKGRVELILAGASVAETELPWPAIPTGGPAGPIPHEEQQQQHYQQQQQQAEQGGAGAGPPRQLAARLLDNGRPDVFPPCIWKHAGLEC